MKAKLHLEWSKKIGGECSKKWGECSKKWGECSKKKNDPTFNLDSWYRKVNFKSDQHQQVSICGDMSDDALYPKYTTLCEVRDVILCQLAAFSALMLTLLRSYQHVLLGGYVNKINLGWKIHLYRKRKSVHTGQSTRVLK